MRFRSNCSLANSGPPGKSLALTCTVPLELSWYTLRRGRQMLWVMPAPATAVAPWEGKTWNEMELPGPTTPGSRPMPRGSWSSQGSLRLCRNLPSKARRLPPAHGPASYLLGTSQSEEQMQRCLSEMQVLLHAKAHLQSGEEGWQDGEPASHLEP